MDGFFACPECGSSVEVEGVAPGRQVRCGFCHRLVEVPYLPRVPVAGWKRRRFGMGRCVRWAWMGVAVVVTIAVTVSAVRMVRSQYRSAQEGAIRERLDSSRALEAEGRLGEALLDLDTALELIRRAGDASPVPLEPERRRRAELALREAGAVLDRLVRDDRDVDTTGDWLTLLARTEKDPDLSELRPQVDEEFRRNVRRRSTAEMEAARRAFESGRVVASLHSCDRVAALLRHLPREAAAEIRRPTRELVDRMVSSRGVALETTRGDFVLGSFESYRAHLLPVLAGALESHGFLPYREESPWKAAWQNAFYRMRLEVTERHEGTYPSSENRLTRINARLVLSSPSKVVWETTPTARTTIPIPGLPTYLATSLELNRRRSDEIERLFYENARNQIDGKFSQALTHMPACCP